MNEYTHYGNGFGILYRSDNLNDYNDEVGELEIIEPFNATVEEVEKALKKSLDNGLSFYENANKKIQKDMVEYAKQLEDDIIF